MKIAWVPFKTLGRGKMIFARIPNKSTEKNARRMADGHALAKIQRTYPVTLASLSPRARRWASFFVEILRIDYQGINCSIQELARNEFRVNGQTGSARTAFRAIRELERAGALTRTKTRLGDDRFSVIISLNADYFSWILKGREYRPTSHISPQLPSCREVPRTDPDPSLSIPSFSKEQTSDVKLRQGSGETGTTNEKMRKKHKHNPVIFTLMQILKGNSEKNCLLYRAEMEISGKIPPSSGIDWAYYASNWQTWPIPQRENVAKSDILPILQEAIKLPNNIVKLSESRRPKSAPVSLLALAGLSAPDAMIFSGSGGHGHVEMLAATRDRGHGPHHQVVEMLAAPGAGVHGPHHQVVEMLAAPDDGGHGHQVVENFLTDEDFFILSSARERAANKKNFL
jgi:hypothetical protein